MQAIGSQGGDVDPLFDSDPRARRRARNCLPIAALCALFDRLGTPYEILCVDDGSGSETQSILQSMLPGQPALRLWRLAAPAGASVALSAGIAAARGEIVLAIKAGEQHAAEHIPQLLYQLSRSDLVYVRPRLGGWRKFRHRLTRIPRSLVFGLEVRQPERLFWAARREAIAGISLGRGMLRYLPWLVAHRGFRVGDMVVEDTASGPPIRDAWPNPWNLFAAWWACRRWSDNATGRIAVHEPSAADADRAADEFLLVDPRAPAALRAGRLAKHSARVIGPSQTDVRYDAPHTVPAPVHSKAA